MIVSGLKLGCDDGFLLKLSPPILQRFFRHENEAGAYIDFFFYIKSLREALIFMSFYLRMNFEWCAVIKCLRKWYQKLPDHYGAISV